MSKKLKKLERTLSAYFDYIENQLEIRTETNLPFTMVELSESVDRFLNFNDFKILTNKGKISHSSAIVKAEEEYMFFNKTQQIESDFDKFVKKQVTNERES